MIRMISDIVIYLSIAAALAWFFFYWLRRDLLGRYIGTFLVSLLGCILGGFLFNDILKKVVDLLQRGLYISNVNVLASLIGGYVLLYLYNFFNHDKKRH